MGKLTVVGVHQCRDAERDRGAKITDLVSLTADVGKQERPSLDRLVAILNRPGIAGGYFV